jgi:hypothetical protein
VCVVITVAMEMLLRDFESYGMMCVCVCVCCYNRCRGNAVKGF